MDEKENTGAESSAVTAIKVKVVIDTNKKEFKPEVLAEQAPTSVVLVRIEGYRRAKVATSSSLLNTKQK